jgi:hypothetical protein
LLEKEVAGEEDPKLRPVKAQMSRGVPRGPEDVQIDVSDVKSAGGQEEVRVGSSSCQACLQEMLILQTIHGQK